MKTFIYDLHLLDPVLLNQIGGGDPNSAIGFDYIPGSVIRGAFIGRYLRHKKVKNIDACDGEFHRLFFSGNVLFLNAYPLSKSGERTLPTPLSWHMKKGDYTEVFDHAIYPSPEYDENQTPIIWIKVDGPFCCFHNEGSHETKKIYRPSKCVMLHTARGNKANGPDKRRNNTPISLEEARNENLSGTNSSIFRYESLDSGQVMSGAILVKDETCSKILQEILYEDVLRLGKSHLTGYGRVRLENLQELDRWKEYELADEDEEEMIIVTLLSDAIIRNEETGAYTSDISPALGTEENNKPIASFARMALRGGFNRTWNLPLPQVHAIVAGSVFVYDKDEKLKKRLQELEISGIGEKKEEGFGRIAINWHREENFEIKSEDVEETGTTIPAEENAHFIGTIAERLLRTELDRLL